MSKVFYSVDVHGAESVWQKWLRVPELYDVDALLLCGDLTGKSLVPIIAQEDGTHKAFYFGKNWTLETKTEVDEMDKKIKDAGAYTLRCDKDKIKELQTYPQKVEKLMMQMIKDRIAKWMQMILDKIDINTIDVIAMPGNDDDFEIDEVMKVFKIKELPFL